MTTPTIRAMLEGQPAAIDDRAAAPLLAMSMPDGQAAAMEGERFQVQRGLAVVPLRGMLTANSMMLERYLGWTTYHGLAETCAHLAADQDVRAVVLEVDSPGGMVRGIDAAVQAVAALAAAKPVHALVNPLAASAAYWVASQATEIVATPGSELGSIGIAVMTGAYVGPGLSGGQLFEFTSTHARAKRPDPTTDEGKAELQRILDELEVRFHGAVQAGRGIAPDAYLAQVSATDDPRDGGATFAPEDAVRRGLADRVMTRAAFYDELFEANRPASSPRGRRASMAARMRLAEATART